MLLPARWNQAAALMRGRLRSVRLTARGTALLLVSLASLIGAYGIGLPELLYLGAFTLALPLAAIASVVLRRVDLRVSRDFAPATVSVGHPATVSLRISTKSGQGVPRVRWRDESPWGTPGGITAVGQAAAGETAGTALNYVVTPPRRGLFHLGPLRVEVDDPFGLCRASLRVGETTPMLVLPAVEPLSVTALSAAVGEGRMPASQRAPGGQDDLSTREYRAGDALRRVHWRATARHGELMVRQEEAVSHAEVRLVLDTRRAGYRDLSTIPDRPESVAFERVVSVAISAALHFSRLGYAVDLVELGARHLAPLASGAAFLRSAATLELSDGVGAPAGSANAVTGARRGGSGAVIAVLASADTESIARLAALRVGCSPAVAFVVATATVAANATAAALSIATRDRLTAAGWNCIEVPPDATVEQVWRAAASRGGARSVS